MSWYLQVATGIAQHLPKSRYWVSELYGQRMYITHNDAPQQSSGRRPTPYTARPLGLENIKLKMSNACVRNRPHYGSHSLVLITNKPRLYRRTQHRFILVAPYMYATCFGPFSGHHQACQYKDLVNKNVIR
jgi:hypothetical protein